MRSFWSLLGVLIIQGCALGTQPPTPVAQDDPLPTASLAEVGFIG